MKQTLLLLFLVALVSASAEAQCCKPKNAETTSGESDLTSQTVKLKVTGITCAGCSKHIHEALIEQEGILDNQVEYPGDLAIVTYNPDKITVQKIIETVVTAGYRAEVVKDRKGNKTKKISVKQ
jgi:mercuric ion binding protein